MKKSLLEFTKGLVDFISNAEVSSGVCCCGDDMSRHVNPMDCGHSPVDSWNYAVSQYRDEFSKLTEKLNTAPRAEWLCPTQYTPPRGIKLQVLTWGGIGTEGHWDHKLYAAWSPMPDTPPHIKHRMMLWATGRKSELGIE